MQVKIMDDTLREGEQTPGVRYTPESRLKIFNGLVDVGIKYVNVGSPSVGHNVDAIKNIVGLGYSDIEIIGHLGCSRQEVDKAVECGLESVKMYIAPTKEHLLAKFGKRFKNINEARVFCLEKVDDSIRYAKKRGIGVISYTAEDMTSTLFSVEDKDFSYKVIGTALDRGATRISLPDTRGRVTPFEAENMIDDFKKNFASYNVEIETHFHNDLGLATANAIAAVKKGVGFVHTTVNGMGERVGITPLEQLDAALYYGLNLDTGIKHDKLYELSKLVESESGFRVARNAPVIGENAFSHTAGRHQQAVVNDPKTYQTLEENVYGRKATLSFGVLTGKEGLKGFLSSCGVDVKGIDDSRITEIVNTIRKYHIQAGINDVSVVREIVQRQLGVDLKIPSSYRSSQLQESYMLIQTDTGTDEILIKAKVMDTLKRMQSIVRVDEIFGGVDYMALLRCPSEDLDKVKSSARFKLHENLNGQIKRLEFFDVGDRYVL